MMGELKQALEILESVLSISSNNENVPTALRYELIKNWVLCKILSNQTFPKSYSVDKDETSTRGLISKALCAAELLFIKDHDIIEVTQCPLIQDVRSIISPLRINPFHATAQSAQSAFTCSKLTVETLEQGVDYVRS